MCRITDGLDARQSIPIRHRIAVRRRNTCAVGDSGTHIELAARGSTIVLALHGTVDETSVRLLVAAIDASVADDWHSVRVDLGAIDRVTPEGAVALASILARYREAERRLVYQAATSAGQTALLAAFATR